MYMGFPLAFVKFGTGGTGAMWCGEPRTSSTTCAWQTARMPCSPSIMFAKELADDELERDARENLSFQARLSSVHRRSRSARPVVVALSSLQPLVWNSSPSLAPVGATSITCRPSGS